MRISLWKGGWVLLVSVMSATSVAGETARTWFDRMGEAVEGLNYRGTFVHVHDNRPEMLEVLHKIDNGKVFERLTSTSGSGREVIRNGDEVRCIFQSRKEVLVNWRADTSPLRSVLPAYDEELEKFYSFDLREDGGDIAGRPTRFVAVKPRDTYRYGYRLWLDRDTAMPLACELVADSGEVIEAIKFTRISYESDIADEEFKPRLSTTDFSEVKPAPRDAATRLDPADAGWQVSDLPAGFALTVVNRHSDGPDEVDHLVYTDGLASISVFAERHREGRAGFDGAASIGVASAFGRRVDDYQITVVGEVPPATVQRIGLSIRPDR